jgi:hypothetical protein
MNREIVASRARISHVTGTPSASTSIMLLPWIVAILVLLAASLGFARFLKRRAKGETPPVTRDTREDPQRGHEAAGRL